MGPVTLWGRMANSITGQVKKHIWFLVVPIPRVGFRWRLFNGTPAGAECLVVVHGAKGVALCAFRLQVETWCALGLGAPSPRRQAWWSTGQPRP